jgi:hypothetical protein
MSGSVDLGKSIVAGVVHTAYSFEHAPEAMLNARANISKSGPGRRSRPLPTPLHYI